MLLLKPTIIQVILRNLNIDYKKIILDLYGTCVKDEKLNRVFPVYYGEAHSVEECLAGCRSLQVDAVTYGYPYAGLEYKTECYCGDEPAGGFDELYTWPDRCNMRCGGEGANWQNCGGAGAMNTWSVPPAQLDGLCVYDHPRDGRIFNGPAIMEQNDMTVSKCFKYCWDQGNGLIIKKNINFLL